MKNDKTKRVGTTALYLGSILLMSVPILGGCGKATARDDETANTIIRENLETINESDVKAAQENPQEPDNPGSTTTVILDGEAFDIRERQDGVNAITDVKAIGSYWLVSGHIGPNNGYYGFYNTETSQWEKEIIGALLTWYGDGGEDIPFSMDTVVYTFLNELYDIDGNLLRKIELDESESEEIYSLKRTSTGVEVYIYNGAMEERMVEVEAPVSTSWPFRFTCFSPANMVNFL